MLAAARRIEALHDAGVAEDLAEIMLVQPGTVRKQLRGRLPRSSRLAAAVAQLLGAETAAQGPRSCTGAWRMTSRSSKTIAREQERRAGARRDRLAKRLEAILVERAAAFQSGAAKRARRRPKA